MFSAAYKHCFIESDIHFFAGENIGECLIYDFENYAPDFELLKVGPLFGSLAPNKDAEFIKSGEVSLSIRPEGSRVDNLRPYFVIPMASQRFSYNYTDFTHVQSVKLSVYNAEEENINLYMGLTTTPDPSYTFTAHNTYSLSPGWNEITYDVLHGAIEFQHDITTISGVYLKFDNYAFSGKEAPVLYADDLCLVQSDAAPKTVEIALAAGEVCDFESDYMKHLFSVSCKQAEGLPDVEIVDAASYGILPASGRKVLRITYHAGARYPYDWPMVGISQKLLEAAGINTLLSGDDADDYVIKFDLYSVDMSTRLGVEYICNYFDEHAAERVYARSASGMYGVDAVVGQWVTYSQRLTDVNANAFPGAYPIEWTTKPREFRLAFGQFFNTGRTEDVIMYWDNIRIEKAEN